MKTPIIIGATVLTLAIASIPGIKAVYDTTGPKFSKEPQVEVGQFTYSQTGCGSEMLSNPSAYAEFYQGFFRGPLINNSGVRVGAGVENWARLAELANEYNALNNGRGSATVKKAEDGSEYIEYDQMDLPGIPRYIINGQVVIKCCAGSNKTQSISIITTIIDRTTGRVVANNRVAGTGEREQNTQVIGKAPSIWERFISGYAREIRYDDLLEDLLGQSALETAKGLLEIDPKASNGRKPQTSIESNISVEKNDCGDPLPPFQEIVPVKSADVIPKTPDAPPKTPTPPVDQTPATLKDKTPLPPVTSGIPKSLQRYCTDFNDTWFTTMQFIDSGYCYLGTWGDIPVTRADAEFGSSLSIGLIGENESVVAADEQYKKDWSGRNIPFGTKRTVEGTYEEFVEVSIGSFATRKVIDFRIDLRDANQNLIGFKHDVSIGYIVRQGRCYATFGVHGIGPQNSDIYPGTLANHAAEEIAGITVKMKKLSVCSL